MLLSIVLQPEMGGGGRCHSSKMSLLTNATLAYSDPNIKQGYGNAAWMQLCKSPSQMVMSSLWILHAASFITTTWLTGLPAPHSVMELLICECYLAYVALHSACFTNQLKYTELGKLQNCNNENMTERYWTSIKWGKKMRIYEELILLEEYNDDNDGLWDGFDW